MKKFSMIVGLVAIVIGILLPLAVVEAASYESDEWYAGSSIRYTLPLLDEDGSIRKNVEIIKIVHKSDGEPAFCVEPSKGTQLTDYYMTIEQDSIFGSLEQRIEVAKIVMAYKAVETDYASSWDTSTTYAAAQYLIWDTIGYQFAIEDEASDYDEFASEIPKILEAKAIFEQTTLSLDLVIEDGDYSVGDTVYVTDMNGILNEDDYVASASEGIDELTIGEGSLSFVITSDEPETKTIEVEHVGEIPAVWEYGELWSDGIGQKFFTFFSVDLPTLYSGASVSLYLSSSGSLIINKVDENGDLIEDGDFTFALYEAIYDGAGYVMGDVIEGYEEIIVKGSTTITVATGHYFIKEIEADEAYIIDDGAYLIEVIADEEVTFTLANPRKQLSTEKGLTIDLSKYDEDDGSPIGGAHFTVYSLEEGDTIYLLKTGTTTDLIDLLGSEDIYIAEEDVWFDGQWFLSDENTHVIAYAISDEGSDAFSLEGFEALVYLSGSYIDSLIDAKVYKDGEDLTASLACIYDGSDRVVYTFSDGSDQYLIIRAKKTYDVGTLAEVSSGPTIYKISDTFDIYTGTSDIYDGSSYSVKEVAGGVTSDAGKVSFTGLTKTADYLVCEVALPDDYGYGDQDPCIAITGDRAEVTNVTFTDKVRIVDIVMVKTDTSREISLDGAEFIAYRAKKTDGADLVFEGEVPEDAIYMGYFVSGYLHATLADFGLADAVTGYTLEIYSDGELIKEVAMEDEVNVGGLSSGTYDLYLRHDDGDVLSTTVQKEVAKGRIIFEDIRCDEVLILFEVKAPNGYKTDEAGFVISADGQVINGRVTYNRVNEAVILPPNDAGREIVKTYTR